MRYKQYSSSITHTKRRENLIPGYINDLRTKEDLWKLSAAYLQGHRLAKEEFIHIARLCGAFWQHSGNPEDPHVVLSSGYCSNGFVDVGLITSYTNLCEILAQELIPLVRQHYPTKLPIHWVVGSAYSAADISHAVARRMFARHAIPIKEEWGQDWRDRPTIRSGETVLQVEDVTTTGKSARKVREGISRAHEYRIDFIPLIATVISRTAVRNGERHEGGITNTVALFSFDFRAWAPAKCPLCEAGSAPLHSSELIRSLETIC